MKPMLKKLAAYHQAFWTYDRWYRRAWWVWPQALTLTLLVFIAASGVVAPPSAPWAKPPSGSSSGQNDDDQGTCMDEGAEYKARGEACDRLIKLGKLFGAELSAAYSGRAWMRYNDHQHELSIADYNEAIKLDPNNANAHSNLAGYYLDDNDLPKALSHYDAAIKILPDWAQPHAGRGEVLRRQGKLPEALAEVQKALELEPGLSWAGQIRDAIQADKSKPQQGDRSTGKPADQSTCMDVEAPYKARGEACDRLIKLGQVSGAELSAAYFGRAWMRYNDHQHDLAIADYNEAIKLNPDNGDAHSNLAAYYLKANDLPDALTHYDAAIRIFPDWGQPRAGRGEVLRRQGKLPEALAEVQKALELEPDSSWAAQIREAIQSDLNKQGRPGGSAAQPQRAPDPLEALRARASEQISAGSYDDAIATFGELIKSGKASAEDYIQHGQLLTRKGASGTAWDDFNKAVEMAPANAEAHYWRGLSDMTSVFAILEGCRKFQSRSDPNEVMITGGPCSRPPDFSKAIKDFQQAIDNKPEFAEAYFQIARIQEALGRNDEALRAYTAAIRVAPDFSAAYNNRGVLYTNLKQKELAFADFNEAIRSDPRNKQSWANRAYYFAQAGRRQQAIADFRKALDIDDQFTFALDGLRKLGVRP